jgi:hypothetical protein
MSWLSAILGLLQALPKLLDALRGAYRRFQEGQQEKKREQIEDEVKKDHDDLRNGTVPRRD